MPSAFIYNQTTKMKKKRITYGVYGMMEYQTIIKIGRATLKVLFTDGSITSIGQNPAMYTTSDFLVQRAIENSSEYKKGRIMMVNTIELDEEVRIERNPALEQPRHLDVGGAHQVKDLDRVAVHVERGARGQDHRRGGGAHERPRARVDQVVVVLHASGHRGPNPLYFPLRAR